MDALVAYESSSDEESTPAPKFSSKTQVATRTVPSINGDVLQDGDTSNVRSADDESTPMIGPTRPDDNHNQADGQPALQELPDDLSEQDLIRYLTQASHPMTDLPPSPPGSPNPQVEAKFQRFLELKNKGMHFNEDLAKKATFRNPALLATLMNRAGIEGDSQYASSLPSSVWNHQSLPAFAYKEELLKSQQHIRDQEAASKKQASTVGKRKIEFTPGSRSGASSRTSTPGIS